MEKCIEADKHTQVYTTGGGGLGTPRMKAQNKQKDVHEVEAEDWEIIWWEKAKEKKKNDGKQRERWKGETVFQ